MFLFFFSSSRATILSNRIEPASSAWTNGTGQYFHAGCYVSAFSPHSGRTTPASPRIKSFHEHLFLQSDVTNKLRHGPSSQGKRQIEVYPSARNLTSSNVEHARTSMNFVRTRFQSCRKNKSQIKRKLRRVTRGKVFNGY